MEIKMRFTLKFSLFANRLETVSLSCAVSSCIIVIFGDRMEERNPILMNQSANSTSGKLGMDPKIVKDLRDIGFRMSLKEMELLRRRNAREAERRLKTRDPPCAACGTWSDDWLCPNCRERFPWMHPDFGGH
jgi:rubrerythrin